MANGKLGIFAGKGELPWIAVRNAIKMGEHPIVFLLTDEAPPAEFESISYRVNLTKFYSSVLKSLKRFQVKRLVSLGKIPKTIIYESKDFDLRTLILLAKMRNKNDYTIFQYLNRELEKHGIEVLPQTLYLKDCFLEEGRYGKKLSRKQVEDVVFGMYYAIEINRLDIGQCVVVGDKVVWAVEGPEGTDECIRRAGSLYKKGAVVCKVGKRNHDPRFDIPVIGTSTLQVMKETNSKVLAIETNGTIVVRREEFLKKAKEFGITILSLKGNLMDANYVRSINRRAVSL
ncbi:MAG: UDP-2,3-diacylglucosamine diphosphatase LpxI [Leptospiraceae bacterium]|nr:UDP-2,3-diacylglucosamine diphosphatase LpxI [Leptospiraceae bacterium]MDW7976047.1 UDP-2,3-diacylglucosamine diphosphatase LpxI [Leptospiraceae bacterium]